MSMYDKKPLQYCKVISLQLIKINEKKKNQKLISKCLKHIEIREKIIERQVQINCYTKSMLPRVRSWRAEWIEVEGK